MEYIIKIKMCLVVFKMHKKYTKSDTNNDNNKYILIQHFIFFIIFFQVYLPHCVRIKQQERNVGRIETLLSRKTL